MGGDEWKGYIVRITGGNDKQGFPMKQGVLTAGRVRLLLGKGHKCYRQRRTGERKRRSVRGCIVDAQLSVLNLAIVKKGDNDIPGLTDTSLPKRLGPKRASIWLLQIVYRRNVIVSQLREQEARKLLKPKL